MRPVATANLLSISKVPPVLPFLRAYSTINITRPQLQRPSASLPKTLCKKTAIPLSFTFQRSSYSTSTNTMATIEDAKKAAAREAVANHYPRNPKFVGIGSGTTIVYVVEAIKDLGFDNSTTGFVPTGYHSNQLIIKAGLTPIAFDALPEGAVLDVSFDGADEVDDDLNCIKGGGACLFQEKLVALQAKEFICVADWRKNQSHLLTSWPSIPIEVEPLAVRRVISQLKRLGSPQPILRESPILKEGPVKTDQGFFIVDAPFPKLLLPADVEGKDDGEDGKGKDGVWEVSTLAKEIKQLAGVLEVGLFYGITGRQAQAAGGVGGQKPVAAYFGMTDGSVTSKKAK